MKFRRNIFWLALAAVCTASALEALPRPERSMAAEAFAAGDYRNASSLYGRARELALKDGDDNAWMEDTVGMARSLLRLGDTEAARKYLDEFTRRFPAHSPGLLPGEILAAEGRISEAESFFRAVKSSSADHRLGTGAELALVYLQLRFGSSALALEELSGLEESKLDPDLRRDTRLLRIYAMIRAGRADEAKKLAAESAENFTPKLPAWRLKLLSLLADLRSGQGKDFFAEWEKLRSGIRPHPDPLVFETLDTAARLLMKSPDPRRAALCWSDACGFAGSDDERKDALRKLFNCASTFDAKLAAETARRYSRYFPGASDRAQLLTGAGRLLAGDKDYRGALELFASVVSDGELLLSERADAARDAALAAEVLGDDKLARHYFNSLVSSAESAAGQQREQISFAEYLLRRRDYAEAETVLRQVSGSAVRELDERASRLLIPALIRQKKYLPALAEAKKLEKSANAGNAEFGEYHAAFLAEKLGRRAEARRQYLDFAKRYKKGEFVRGARFAAALLALGGGENKEAAREFLGYAAEFPKAPDAGAALFWAVRAFTLAGDLAGAESAFSAFASGPGIGKEHYAAALQLAEFMRSSGEIERGVKFLAALDKSKCAPEDSAALLLVRARLLRDARKNADALRDATEIVERYPNTKVEADAAFLAGDLYVDRGEYEEAKRKFERALELRPTGLFGEAARGRIGDCLLAAYGSTQENDKLKQAVEVFDKLAGDAEFPAVRLQSLFKLGRALEYCGDEEERVKAYDAYYRALLYAGTLKKRGIPFDPSWCSRSAYAALRLLMKYDDPGRFQQGTRVIDAYRQLGAPENDADFEALKKEFHDRYLNREM